MARKRSKNSNNSFGGLGMTPEQDKRIQFFLKESDTPSLKYLIRSLMRGWLVEQERALNEKEEQRVKEWERKNKK